MNGVIPIKRELIHKHYFQKTKNKNCLYNIHKLKLFIYTRIYNKNIKEIVKMD